MVMAIRIAFMLVLPLCIVGKKWFYSTSYGSWYIHAGSCPDYDSWHAKGKWFSNTDTQASETANAVDAGKSCVQLGNVYFGTTNYLRGILFATPDNCTIFFHDMYVGLDVSNPSTGVIWAVTTPVGTGPWNVSSGDAKWGSEGTCYGFERKICANKDGAGTAVKCRVGYTAKDGSTPCQTCSDDGNECCTELLRGNIETPRLTIHNASRLVIVCSLYAFIHSLTARTCANKDGAGTAVVCGTGLTAKPGSTSCQTCANNGLECCLCGFHHWGSSIPFVKKGNVLGKVSMVDHLQHGYITLKFTLATQPCVDRVNQLSLSFHGIGRPVCQAVAAADKTICASRLVTSRGNFGHLESKMKSKSACEQDSKCRYRIPCTKDNLDLKDVFSVQKSYDEDAPHTVFAITIRTDKLSTKGVKAGVYTAPQTSASVAKIEVCIRPSVAVHSTEVLFREIVAAVNMEMTGRVALASAKLDIESDTDPSGNAGQDKMDENMDNKDENMGKEITTDTFACQIMENNIDITYEKIPPVPRGPDNMLTLCVTGTSSAIRCTDISDIEFKTDAGGNSANNIPKNAITRSKMGADILKDGGLVNGCVLAAKFGGWYDHEYTPMRVTITGKARMLPVPKAEANHMIEKSFADSTSIGAAKAVKSGQEEHVAFSFEFEFMPNVYAVSGGATAPWMAAIALFTAVLMTM